MAAQRVPTPGAKRSRLAAGCSCVSGGRNGDKVALSSASCRQLLLVEVGQQEAHDVIVLPAIAPNQSAAAPCDFLGATALHGSHNRLIEDFLVCHLSGLAQGREPKTAS